MPNIISVRPAHLYRILLVVATMLGIIYYILLAWPAAATINTKMRDDFAHMSEVDDLYTYYTEGGIHQGLEATGDVFTLNKKDIFLVSGALHYYRVPRAYWRDRLSKLKSAGLNAVETYVAWNLHEARRGEYDFSGELDLLHFFDVAKEVGLFVIVRPGPYICTEWDFGGLPAWLLRDPDMRVRTTYAPFMAAVERYFGRLLPLVRRHNFQTGGAVIAYQVENEYGWFAADAAYMDAVAAVMRANDVGELLFTSDAAVNLAGHGTMRDVLATINLQSNPTVQLQMLKGASVNYYMFFGGTNFGFMNGANGALIPPYYQPTITSYDYDALLTESGDVTPKYIHAVDVMRRHVPGFPATLPPLPPKTQYALYGKVTMTSYLTLDRLLELAPMEMHTTPVSMEMLNCNNDSGQGHGFTLYRKRFETSGGGTVQLRGRVADRAVIKLYNSAYQFKMLADWLDEDFEFIVPDSRKSRMVTPSSFTLDVLVENMGRVNFQSFQSGPSWLWLDRQRKGLLDDVLYNDVALRDWQIFPLQFDAEFMEGLAKETMFSLDQSAIEGNGLEGPAMFRGHLNIEGAPRDTFIRLEGWVKGSVFVNNVNIGRYWEEKGPQKTLYVPAPFLKEGENVILV
ncbi:PREDICTED: beta-galactosidase-1-like protein 2 [Priapulus caudatus]|uniref:Beta-galactosidase-1-like protein 2 n=1 Tax=Priapulus caudatus TaxID=37621 RepID=A0ABM1EP15_PRICU|nr:PREDICTED: beta-galactosidase-1-like protein 2 [Priapulus caudatus]